MLTNNETTGTEAMSERKKHEVDLFYEALGTTDPVARTAFLARACAGESALRERLEQLLSVHAEAERFFVREEVEIHSQMDAHQEQ
jgi:hypothetical protein